MGDARNACLLSVVPVACEDGAVGDRAVVLGSEGSAREIWVGAAELVDHE